MNITSTWPKEERTGTHGRLLNIHWLLIVRSADNYSDFLNETVVYTLCDWTQYRVYSYLAQGRTDKNLLLYRAGCSVPTHSAWLKEERTGTHGWFMNIHWFDS